MLKYNHLCIGQDTLPTHTDTHMHTHSHTDTDTHTHTLRHRHMPPPPPPPRPHLYVELLANAAHLHALPALLPRGCAGSAEWGL